MGRSSSSHVSHPVLASTAPSPFDLASIWELASTLAGKTSAIFSTLATTVARLTQTQADLHFFVGAIPSAIAEQDHLLPVADGSYRYGTLAVHPHPQHVYLPALPLQHAQILADATSNVMQMLESTMYAQFRQRHASLSSFEPLTAREREVLTLLYRRYTKPEIAAVMHISMRTVETHQKHLYKKLGVHREIDAILVGLEAGYFLYLA